MEAHTISQSELHTTDSDFTRVGGLRPGARRRHPHERTEGDRAGDLDGLAPAELSHANLRGVVAVARAAGGGRLPD